MSERVYLDNTGVVHFGDFVDRLLPLFEGKNPQEGLTVVVPAALCTEVLEGTVEEFTLAIPYVLGNKKMLWSFQAIKEGQGNTWDFCFGPLTEEDKVQRAMVTKLCAEGSLG